MTVVNGGSQTFRQKGEKFTGEIEKVKRVLEKEKLSKLKYSRNGRKIKVRK